MLNSFGSSQFVYWIEKMGITYEEASRLLNVKLRTIEDYAYGIVKIPSQKAAECQLLLKLKFQRLKGK